MLIERVPVDFHYLGGLALACSSDLRRVLFAGTFQPYHRGGDVLLCGPDASQRMLLSGDDYYGETHTAVIGPATVLAVPEEDCREAWLTAWDLSGSQLWRRCLTQLDWDADGDDELEQVSLSLSGDARLVAAGARRDGLVVVVDVADGRSVHENTDGTIGHVALDHTGQRVAYALADGVLVVRDVASGEVLLHQPTALPDVDAMAFAPDGSAVVAVCRTTVCVVSLDGTSRVVTPTLGTVMRFATQATWGAHGLRVFVTGDSSAVFDGEGRILWQQEGSMRGAFTPDGRVLVTARPFGDTAVSAWVL